MSEEKPTPQEIADGIRQIKALIDKPEKWTKGTLAKDEKGFATNPHGKTAKCFCLTGAFAKSFPSGGLGHAPIVLEIGAIFKAQARRRGFRLAHEFNDAFDTDHAAVMTFLDNSITQAEKMET